MYSVKEVIGFVKENDVKFIRLAFSDIFGNLKNVAIMPSELNRALNYGISVAASAYTGTADSINSDLYLLPDPSTLTILPWRPKTGRVVRFICDIRLSDGSVFAGDARNELKKTAERIKKLGYECNIGTECQFYLFNVDENGEPTKTPYDKAGYLDVAPKDKCENIRREICLALEEMDIHPETSRHEYGRGQNEIDFRHSDIVSAADNLVKFKSAVKTIAGYYGLHASFMPKPMHNQSGSGLHINISMKKDGRSIFAPKLESMTDDGKHFIAGVLNRVNEMTCFLNPLTNSYSRFASEGVTPKYVDWSVESRSHLIRIPNCQEERMRMELRSPDPSCNPYIALNFVLCAGLEGINEKEKLSEGSEATRLRLPHSLEQAVELAEKSGFVASVLPKEIKAPIFEAFEHAVSRYNSADDKVQFEEEFYFGDV